MSKKQQQQTFTPQELEKALYFSQEELQTRFFLPLFAIGETLETMRINRLLGGNQLSPALRRNEVGESGQPDYERLIRNLKQYINTGRSDPDYWGRITKDIEITPDQWTFSLNDVPIVVKIVERDNLFFQNPEILHFNGVNRRAFDSIRSPNPWKEYLASEKKGGGVK